MKLSIITINLNNKEGLQKTIDSVVCQTFKDYEWIVIDGGSTDGSKELIEQYAAHFSYWVSEPDKGIYSAMNKGIRAAKGEYCLFLNSGDAIFSEDVLEKLMGNEYTEDVVYGQILMSYFGNKRLGAKITDVTLRTFIEGTINHTGNAFIRQDAFLRFGLYDENLRIVSDWKWFLQHLGLGNATTRFVDVITCDFDGNGLSEQNLELRTKERTQVLKECVPYRILDDYMKFSGLEDKLYNQEMEIRSSLPYRLGKFILTPLKFIQTLFR